MLHDTFELYTPLQFKLIEAKKNGASVILRNLNLSNLQLVGSFEIIACAVALAPHNYSDDEVI